MNHLLTGELEVTSNQYKKIDEISTHKEIYSVTLEVLGYTGPLFQIMKDDNTDPLDIYPLINGYPDVEAIMNHAGSNTYEVSIIYGQKGFSDLIATFGNRGNIVTAGVLETSGGYAAILADGVNTYYTSILPYGNSTTDLSVTAVFKHGTISGAKILVGTSAIGAGFNLYFSSTNYALCYKPTQSFGAYGSIDLLTDCITQIQTETQILTYRKGVLSSTVNNTYGDYVVSGLSFSLFAWGAKNNFDGYFQFAGISLNNESANAVEVYNELNGRFNIDGLNAGPIYLKEYRHFATETYVTKSTDTLANTVFIGSMSKALSIKKELGHFIWGSQSKTTAGNITLINNDGAYDDLYSKPTRDSVITFKIIKQGESFDTATQVGVFHVDQVSNQNDDYIDISFVDKIAILDKNTLNPSFSNTIQFVNNRNLPMPVPIGFIYQAPLSIVDSTTNQYHLMPEYSAADDANVESTILAKDRADPFILNTDYTVVQLTTTAGMGIDLTSPNDGTITADYMGYRYNGNDTNTFENFVGKLLVDYGGLDVTDIDFTSAAQIDTDNSFNYGYYAKENENIKTILDSAVLSHNGFYYQANSGKITFGELKTPDVTSVFDIDSLSLKSGVKVSIDTAPGLSDSVAALKNWHVYSYDEVRDIGTLSEEDKQAASSEYREKAISTTTVANSLIFDDAYAHARHGYFIPTLLTGVGNAPLLVSKFELIYDKTMFNYDLDFLIDNIFSMLALELNDTVKLIHNRYGLDAGKYMRIISLEIPNAINKLVKIRGWG